MGFRLVSSAGMAQDPVMIDLPASGVIHKDGGVQFDIALGAVSPALENSPTTAILGVSQNSVVGASDSFAKVILFVPGQLWEADCVSPITTLHVLRKHRLYNDVTLENAGASTVNDGESVSAGVFFAYALTGSTSGSGKLIGTFLTGRQAHRGTDSAGLTF